MSNKFFKTLSALLALAIIAVALIFSRQKFNPLSAYDDGIDNIDPDTIKLGGRVRVSFSDVILSKANETRKLVVYEQEGTVKVNVEDRVIEQLDIDLLKKNQAITYSATGHFVVDLDELKAANLIDDPEAGTLTIRINHPHLDSIDIDPNDVKIGAKEGGFLALGELKLSLQDYNEIEKELHKRLNDKFNTSANGQKADDLALAAVYKIYQPIVNAVNPNYTLKIEFIN
ncbi:MAG: DUF4230 domain-containing protein [Pseudobutyrivibrio sp.]|nr:DUF4230 domain-containing protein [Pseudobutyrivibrio sp.]